MRNDRNNISGNSVEILKGLDELDLEETEMLLLEINKVTLSPKEEMVLKEKVLKKVRSEAWESIGEADKKTVKEEKVLRTKSRICMRRITACIAVVMFCSIAAIAATNMEGLQRYWGGDTRVYRDRAIKTIQSVKNENIKANIEGIVTDNYQCVFIFSVEALTKEGRKIIDKNISKHHIVELKINPKMIEGSPNTGIFEYTDDNKNKDYKAYKCDFELKNVDVLQPVTVEFAGLTMNFDIPKYMQVITLYPDSEAGFASVELSPIGFYYKAAEYAEEVRLIKNNGTLEDDDMGYFSSMGQKDNGEVTSIVGSFTRLIDLNDYLGIQIDGINYTAKKSKE
ncbi:hypothetical protein [Aminipila terrae]|uniref:DUF4179 domain-containing protein n=1 Tax=Aminipila terrae TaxID=2697030 RepID=A0A6P1MIJ8_9FIRM|nr:hypothetical protein [Aminipila terrae]QHI72434.1 hypothetical protein Ami3637_08530 [Aminipila terrae]